MDWSGSRPSEQPSGDVHERFPLFCIFLIIQSLSCCHGNRQMVVSMAWEILIYFIISFETRWKYVGRKIIYSAATIFLPSLTLRNYHFCCVFFFSPFSIHESVFKTDMKVATPKSVSIVVKINTSPNVALFLVFLCIMSLYLCVMFSLCYCSKLRFFFF